MKYVLAFLSGVIFTGSAAYGITKIGEYGCALSYHAPYCMSAIVFVPRPLP